jgi:hypothetical protein
MTAVPILDAAAPVAESVRTGVFREAVGSLTIRGRGFMAGGVAAALCGLVLGERDLVRIGFVAVLVPIVAVVWIARAGNRLGLVRSLSSNRVGVGQEAPVRLEVTNVGPRTGLLLAEEQIPWALGTRPRFLIDALRPGQVQAVDYPVSAEQRGRYQIGPLRIRAADPTGMVEIDRVFTKTAELVVVPTAEPLPSIPLLGGWTGTGDNRPRPFAGGSAADVTVREYRQGDEVRRVHWPSSARTGKLMVRSEEQPWQSRCTLLIDNRASAHRGHGPDSSLERAVTTAASIAVHLSRHGYVVRLVSAHGTAAENDWHDDVPFSPEPILDQLAVLPTIRSVNLHDEWVDDTVTAGMMIAVLGATDDHDRALLARIRHRGSAAYAITMDVDTWLGRAVPLSPGRPAGGEAARWLRHHGWKAASLPRGGSIASTWQELGR